MSDWTSEQLSSSLCYGTLFAVARIDKHMHLARVRKRKGQFALEAKTAPYHVMDGVEVGQFLFREREGKVTVLKPEKDFAERLNKAIGRVR
jgi:hypothetical protein